MNVGHAWLVDHGSTAIRAALWALKLRDLLPAGSVGAPCNVWRGVFSSVAFSGSKHLRLLDVDSHTGVLNRKSFAGIPENLDAVVSVDGYGIRPSMAELKTFVPTTIEDASLSQYPSRTPAGGLAADISVMSLQANKILSCGEGGLILTDRSDLAETIEATVCDGRTWFQELTEEPLVMGFNGMMSEQTAASLLGRLGEDEQYRTWVARGAEVVLRELGPTGVPSWVDPTLINEGRLFALPVKRTAYDGLSKVPFDLDSPPLGPDRHLHALLDQLPITVACPERFDGASTFAARYGLLPHWKLAKLGRRLA
ncbi:DegT/DnrJ/EryC1/StrS family aminotransferase [Pseudofrankia sp. DC12]|uniref:DegT/DnrJ/EryC1/StrS family aminotransferase n=1 Tax=Pseudofrankia sp. DC12 TaxID=683315 RepID=UPI001E5083CF|nr:DegT/DnrJ/EryC1/StrS family aminotransferase [Pseudofrankia sp. DC12]